MGILERRGVREGEKAVRIEREGEILKWVVRVK